MSDLRWSMATKKTKTGWLRFGRSGDTIDGREINDQDILEAAKDYDPGFYTALIWYEHRRGNNLGKVLALRSEKNDEGGLDLYGQFQPNDYYKLINSAEQKLFLSMELFRNFRKTGKTYLSGLAATDEPASVATSEVRFSRASAADNEDALISEFTESTTHQFSDNPGDDVPSWFTKLFKSNTEDDMSKQALEALQTQFAALTDEIKAMNKKDDPVADDSDDNGSTDYSAVVASVKNLEERFTAFEDKQSDGKDDEATLQLNAMQTKLDELTIQLSAALEENGGTDAGEDTGGEDLTACV